MNALPERLQEALGAEYVIGEELPGGGMSRLFLAEDRALRRKVVVKVLPEDRLYGLSPERFQREILFTAQLTHAHIVGILDTGVMGGVPFYIMPFVEGRSLRALLDERGALSVRETVSILRDVARACAFAHAKGVIHRDIKPGNVLLAGGSAVITDFGVAKAIASSAEPEPEREADSTLTRAGFTIGTPAYMAPEQAAGERTIDQRADLYSLGVVAFEMLSGQVPFEGRTPRELLTAQLTQHPPAVATRRPEVPAALSDLIANCLAKNPADRPASAEQLLGVLEELPLTGGSHPSLVAVMGRNPWVRRGLATIALAAVALLGVRWATGGNRPVDPITRLAVLPFATRSADTADAYLAAGLTDALASALGRDPAVRVASRLSTEEYADRTTPPATIGERLQVGALLDGSVQRQSDRIRVTVQLVDTRSGSVLWSETYDRQATDLLSVQADIADAIVTALQRQRGAKLAKAERLAGGFRVAEAYDRYLQGRYAFAQRGGARLRDALEHFQAAARLDPAAARGFSGLADTYVLLPLYGGMAVDSALTLALAHANRAVALDSSSAEVLASRGVVHLHRWEWDRAAADLDRAIRLDPRYAAAHQWRGELDLVTGRFPESASRFRTLITFDPNAPLPPALGALALGAAGNPDSALALARQAVRLDPSLAVTRLIQGAVLLYADQPLKAVGSLEAALALEPDSEQALGLLGFAYGRLGDSTRARAIAAQLESPPLKPNTHSALAKVWLGLGDTSRALDALERAAARHEPFFASEPLGSPLFASLAGHPRLSAIRGQVGLAPVTAPR